MPSENPYRIGKLVEYVNDESVLDIGRQLVSVMKWDGVADIDLLVNERDHSVMILEFNPRFWQSLLGGMIAGVNFPLIWCLSAKDVNLPSSQHETTRYARPSLFIKMLTSKFNREPLPVKIRWREGDLQFTVRDPVPELFDVARKAVRRFRHESLN
jgi:predicted ATP-grasp superfamily ATP-dependent carboligase